MFTRYDNTAVTMTMTTPLMPLHLCSEFHNAAFQARCCFCLWRYRKKERKAERSCWTTGKFSVLNNSGASGTTICKMGLILFLVSRNFFDNSADDFHVSEKQIWKHPSPLVSLHLCLCNQDVWSWQFEDPGPTTIAGERWTESFFLHLACGLILLDLPQSERIPFKFPPKAELLCNSQQHRAKSVINFWIGLGTGRFSFCTQCFLPPC